MSRNDFERCTPSEFSEIYRQHIEEGHIAWERTRMLAYTVLAPFSKKGAKPTDIMQFPWEKDVQETHRMPKGNSSLDRALEVAKKAGVNV